MYTDLTADERVELAIEHLLRGLVVPAKLQNLIGEDDMKIIMGLVTHDE